LQTVGNGTDSDKAVEANGLYHQVSKFFLLNLVAFDKILSCTKGLSDQLQSTEIDFSQAAELVVATKSTLKDFRTEVCWNKLFHYVTSITDFHKIEVEPETTRIRQRRLHSQYKDGVILETTGSRDNLSSSDSYKIALFFPAIDTFLSELSRRFDEKNMNIMHAIQACNPLGKKFLLPQKLSPLAEMYGLDVDIEAKLAKRMFDKKKGFNTWQDVYSTLLSLSDAFPELLKLVKITMTIAISTESCERSFSTVKRIKSHLRSTMTEQRLTGLTVLSIEREPASSISLDDAIEIFNCR